MYTQALDSPNPPDLEGRPARPGGQPALEALQAAAPRGIRTAVAVIGHADLDMPAAAAHQHLHMLGLGVLEHIGQCFLQQTQQIQTPCGSQMQIVQAFLLPIQIDARDIQALVPAVTQGCE